MLAELPDCPDVTTYNQRRLLDPSLPPIPALWVITDEYNEVFADPIYGPKFRKLYLRIARVGRSSACVPEAGRPDQGQPEFAGHHQVAGLHPGRACGTEEEARRALMTPARPTSRRPARRAPAICGWR